MKIKTLVLISFICLFGSSANAQNIDITKAPTITVTGTAEIQVVPDEATFSLRVSKTDKNLLTAKAKNDENIARIIVLAKRFNIAPTDTKTDFISVKEEYECIKQKDEAVCTSTFVGYRVSKTVVIKLKDISKFEDLFSEIIKVGITEISNVEFDSSQLRKHKDQARAMAIRAAKAKAQAFAAEIGQSIGKAVSIEERDIDGYRSPYANVSSNSFSVSDEDRNTETFSIGTISVKAQVEVKFLLN